MDAPDVTKRTLEPEPLEPPDLPEMQRGVWGDLPAGDPLAAHLVAHHWDRAEKPAGWQVARLSAPVLIIRETATGWAVAAKYYQVKASDSADKHAQRELEQTRQAVAAGLSGGAVRALHPLGVWRGVLLLEYVDGLTLQDQIAVRRHRPGELVPCLEGAAVLLATLHAHTARSDASPDFASRLAYAHKLVAQLARWGVLGDNAVICGGLERLIDRWADYAAMSAYVPCLIHGDATTTNFVFPWGGGVVGIDWERLKEADPAADLGRFMAEVAHSVVQYGGSLAEALPLLDVIVAAYRAALPAEWDGAALVQRACFYRASSTLRIARNGWIPRLERMTLVAEACALLADCPA